MNGPRPLGAYALLHLTVLVWGFTGVLGKWITLPAPSLVWYRLVIVTVCMAALARLRGASLRLAARDNWALVGIGALVAVHWLFFYGCIKLAGVAVGVLCLSTSAFFTSLVEWTVYRERLRAVDLGLGVVVVAGVSLLVRLETDASATGFAVGLASSFFGAAFGVFNARLARRLPHEPLATIEFAAAWVVASVALLVLGEELPSPTALGARDAVGLLLLGIGCTVIPWLWSLHVLRTLSAHTMAIAVSLEPIYSMVAAYWLFPDSERLGPRFYAGSAVIVAAVAIDTWRRTRAGAAAVPGSSPHRSPPA